MSLLPNFSNLVHKLQMEVSLFNQLKAGFKESNRNRFPVAINTSTGTAVTMFIAPWSGRIESLIVASATPTTSTSGASVTFTVADVTSSASLFIADTYANATELISNTGVGFYNAQPGLSNGVPVSSFNAGDVITVKGVVTGSTPAGYTAGVTNVVVTLVPTDPKASF
jgi:hypothetical protein